MKKIFFCLAICMLASCEKQQHKVGQYFYVGYGNLYHIDKDCPDGVKDKFKGKFIVDSHDTYKLVYKNGSRWKIQTTETSPDPIYFCSKCIDDEQMKEIEDSVKAVQNIMPERRDNIDVLYEVLYVDGVVQGTRESFRGRVLAPGEEGYNNRLELYKALRSDNYDVPDTFESFSRKLLAH